VYSVAGTFDLVRDYQSHDHEIGEIVTERNRGRAQDSAASQTLIAFRRTHSRPGRHRATSIDVALAR